MSRSKRIWVDASGGSARPFGSNDDDIVLRVCVGLSATNTRLLSTIKLKQYEDNGEVSFRIKIDGQDYRMESFNRKTKQFRGITGRQINGSPKSQKRREKENADSIMKTTASVMAMGAFFASDKKEENDWKVRMLKAGMGDKGLIMPDDWDELTEEEKERRLNSVIEIATK